MAIWGISFFPQFAWFWLSHGLRESDWQGFTTTTTQLMIRAAWKIVEFCLWNLSLILSVYKCRSASAAMGMGMGMGGWGKNFGKLFLCLQLAKLKKWKLIKNDPGFLRFSSVSIHAAQPIFRQYGEKRVCVILKEVSRPRASKTYCRSVR